MKKKIGILLFIIGLVSINSAQAQIKLGIKGGLNISKVDVSNLESNIKLDNMNGFFVGPMIDINIPIIGLGVDGSLLYSEKGTKITNTDGGLNVTNKQRFIEIPLNLKYSIGLGSMASVFVAAGPSFAFNVKSDNIGNDIINISKKGTASIENAVDTKKAEVSMNIGGGVKLLRHLQIGVNYNMPLSDAVKGYITNIGGINSNTLISGKTKGWQMSVAYLF